MSTTQLLVRKGTQEHCTCAIAVSDTERVATFAMSHLSVSNSEAILCEITIASCVVKQYVQNMLTIMIYFHCKIYFMFFIFMVYANHENIFTTKMSRDTLYSELVYLLPNPQVTWE